MTALKKLLSFNERIWHVLAARVPAFERLKLARAWAGHYDMNMFDHNALAGVVPGFANFCFANGFSCHGILQALAIGRGLCELIIHRRYRTLDLSPPSFDRVLNNAPLVEGNVV